MSSANWFERAKAVIPGGVNSPVRAFNSVGGEWSDTANHNLYIGVKD